MMIESATKDMIDPAQCRLCEVWIDWHGSDSSNGTLWECEVCNDLFCEECFKAAHGSKLLHEMISMDGSKELDRILCPGCVSKAPNYMSISTLQVQ